MLHLPSRVKQSRLRFFVTSFPPSPVKATANFDITEWNPASSDRPDVGPEMSRVEIRKTFTGGDIEGRSEGEGLFCGMSDPEAGAGYVVSERVTGQLDGKQGSFVIQHGGLMGPGLEPRTFGHVVPGSGTAELAGLAGEAEVNRTDEGEHTLTINYHFTEDL